jgi:hypothetical protein
VVALFWASTSYWVALSNAAKDATKAASEQKLRRKMNRLVDKVRHSVNSSDSQPEAPSNVTQAYVRGANVITTVQGVILGLVFGFLVQPGPALTIKVAMVSLAVGLVFGLLLYTLSAIEIPPSHRFIVFMLYTTSALALVYGLVCIVSAAVSGHVVAGTGGR